MPANASVNPLWSKTQSLCPRSDRISVLGLLGSEVIVREPFRALQDASHSAKALALLSHTRNAQVKIGYCL
jgi:hypothetical protein